MRVVGGRTSCIFGYVARLVRADDDVGAQGDLWRSAAAGPDGGALNLTGTAVAMVRRQADGVRRLAVDERLARG